MFSSGDIIGGILSGNSGAVVRGSLVGALATLKRQLADPERFLKRSFDLIDNEVPSDFFLRIWGGQRPLKESESNVSESIVKSAKSPAVGMSIQTTEGKALRVISFTDKQGRKQVLRLPIDEAVSYLAKLDSDGIKYTVTTP